MKTNYLGIVCILFGLAAALVYEARNTGLTIDEPSHFSAGFMYWLGEDTVLQPADAPPLTRMVSGWVAVARRAPSLHRSQHWASQDAYWIGRDMLSSEYHHSRDLLFYSRLPLLIFPLGVVFLIWYWGRQLFGPSTALVLALCAALEPTMLGHGALIKSDVAAACSALWFTYAAWKYWLKPNKWTLLGMTAVLLIAVLTKFTLLPLCLFAYLLALWRGPRLLAILVMPLTIYLGILAAAQFQAEPIPDYKLLHILGDGAAAKLLPLLKIPARLPWPTQFVNGVVYIAGTLHGTDATGYMLGRKLHGWTPGYFPLAWAVKFPIPLQLLTLAGLIGLGIRVARKEVSSAEWFIWAAAAWLFGSAVFSNYHIGFRHVLPALPFLILGGGFTLHRYLATRSGQVITVLGIVWLAASALWMYPNGIAYFNEWIGGPKNGWRYLADSNNDWGQNYPELAKYIDRNDVKTIRLFFYSHDDYRHYIKDGILDSGMWPTEAQVNQRYHPVPGLYAIGVGALTGLQFSVGNEDYLAEFRKLTPIAYAGYGILIYNVK